MVRVTPNPLSKTSSTQEELERLLLAGLDSGESQEMTEQDWDDIRQAVRKKVTLRQTADGPSPQTHLGQVRPHQSRGVSRHRE